MQLALRSYVTAGVALVGASVIVVNPVAPPPPDIRVASPDVALAAQPVTYSEVFGAAISNAQAILDTVVEAPAPILANVVLNQADIYGSLFQALGTAGEAVVESLVNDVPLLLETALDELQMGEISDAVNTLLTAVLVPLSPLLGVLPPLLNVVQTPADNLAAAAGALTLPSVALLLIGVGGPLIAGTGATGVAVQGILDEFDSGTPQSILRAIVEAPATILDGNLNGGQNILQQGPALDAVGYGPNLASLLGLPFGVYAGGLLNPLESRGPSLVVPGGIPAVLGFRQSIADAIAPAPPPVVTAAPNAAAAPISGEDQELTGPPEQTDVDDTRDAVSLAARDLDDVAAVGDRSADALADVRDRVDTATGKLAAAAEKARDRASAGLTKARNSVKSTISTVGERVGDLAAKLPGAPRTLPASTANQAGEGSEASGEAAQ